MPDKKLIDECVHCGFCLQACPTYQSWGEEMDSPRGRIFLMKGLAQGTVPLSDTVVRHFDACLGCMSCVTACPSGVQYGTLIEQMRAEVEARHPRSLGDRLFRGLVFALFPYPARLKAMRVLQLFYVWTGLQWLLRKSGILDVLSPRLAQLDRLMPATRRSSISHSLPSVTPAQGKRRARVALITGCVQSVYFSDVNAASVRVLATEGCEVQVPPAQPCCGALSLHAGREHEAREFTRALIAYFEPASLDAVIVNAAGCGSHLKECARLFRNEPDWAARVEAFAAKVRDLNEFLAALGPVAPRHRLPLRVAYHDACHLAHAQRVREQPRALLRAIPDLQLLEVPDADQCCGSAGIYNLLEPESAREIGNRKLESILSTRAQILATANPGCALQIQSLLRERGGVLPCVHPVQLLDASLRGQAAPET